MKIADCPACNAPALRVRLTFAPQRTGIVTIHRSPVVKVNCSMKCGFVGSKGSKMRDTTKHWNDKVKAFREARRKESA